MNAPFIWIILPALIAALLFVLQRRNRLLIFLGTLVAVGLAGLAWAAPFGETVSLGSFTFELGSTFTFFGRRFVLDWNDRYTLMLIYIGVAF